MVYVRDLASLNENTPQKTTEKKWKSVLWMQCDASLVESFERLTNQVLQVCFKKPMFFEQCLRLKFDVKL